VGQRFEGTGELYLSGITQPLTCSCKGCQKDCWGKQWDEEEKKYFCIADGFYLTDEENCKTEPRTKEKVQFT
jgi:hypothetical protein